MFVKTYDGELVNLDNVTGLFKKKDGPELICYIPSSDPEHPYQEFYLGVNGSSNIRMVVNKICNLYKQTLVAATGDMVVPNQVYEIPAGYSSLYFSMNSVTLDRSNVYKSQTLLDGNRLYADVGLMYNGKRLRENIDYTAIYPLYRGNNMEHTIVFTAIRSKTMYYCRFISDYPKGSVLQRLVSS